MSVKDILVHINVSKHCRSRLEIAAHLAKAFDAHLTGLYTSEMSDVPFFMMEEIVAKVEPTLRGWWTLKRNQVRDAFEAIRRDTGVSADWLEVDGDVGAMMPYHARYADLTIVSQVDPEELLPRPEFDVPERVALEAGRPVLVIPYAGTFTAPGRRILVAWNGSAQSARAVKDALPFLQRAERVTVLVINPDGFRKREDERPGEHLTAHLLRHGVKAEVREFAVDNISVDQLILSHAGDEGSDLIVMGAYGHPRAREMVLGGATRALFKHTTTPILMSH